MVRPLTIRAPMAGVVRALDAVDDKVFAAGLVGPGCAILPEPGEPAARSPMPGVLATVHPHAFVVQSGARSVMVHLGIDTVRLRGEGFTTLLEAGAVVGTGDPVLRWDVAGVVGAGLSVLCPVVAIQAEPGAIRWLVRESDRVAAGDAVLEWV